MGTTRAAYKRIGTTLSALPSKSAESPSPLAVAWPPWVLGCPATPKGTTAFTCSPVRQARIHSMLGPREPTGRTWLSCTGVGSVCNTHLGGFCTAALHVRGRGLLVPPPHSDCKTTDTASYTANVWVSGGWVGLRQVRPARAVRTWLVALATATLEGPFPQHPVCTPSCEGLPPPPLTTPPIMRKNVLLVAREQR